MCCHRKRRVNIFNAVTKLLQFGFIWDFFLSQVWANNVKGKNVIYNLKDSGTESMHNNVTLQKYSHYN